MRWLLLKYFKFSFSSKQITESDILVSRKPRFVAIQVKQGGIKESRETVWRYKETVLYKGLGRYLVFGGIYDN